MTDADLFYSILWLLFAAVLMLSFAWRTFRRQVVGDIEMLQLGAVVYLAVPYLLFFTDSLDGYPGIHIFQDLFSAAAANSLAILAVVVGCAFFYRLGYSVRGPAPTLLNRSFSPNIVRLVIAALWLGWAALVIPRRGDIGAGYSIEYDPKFLGQLGTINLTVTILLLNANQFWAHAGTVYKTVAALLLVNSLVLLSLGGRMYVFSALIALALQKVSMSPRRMRLKFVGVSLAAVLVMIFVGVWRGSGDLDLGLFGFVAAGEPVFTSLSLGSFVEQHGIPALAFPYQFLGSIINFVPSALFTNKIDFIPSIQEHLDFESPFGATNLIVSLIGNFGWIGSLVFALIMGSLMKGLLSVQRRGWWLYFYVCSLLPFMFFRDGFSIFNKAAIFNGMILPYMMLLIDRRLWSRRLRTASK